MVIHVFINKNSKPKKIQLTIETMQSHVSTYFPFPLNKMKIGRFCSINCNWTAVVKMDDRTDTVAPPVVSS